MINYMKTTGARSLTASVTKTTKREHWLWKRSMMYLVLIPVVLI